MTRVIVAKKPQLDFILTSHRRLEKNNCPLPLILKENGLFDWNANAFLTAYAGGPQVYNIKPLAPTVVKKAYSLNVFCSFLEVNAIELSAIDDSVVYSFVDSLKDRGVNDQTILSHARTALQYIIYLNEKYPIWRLATPAQNSNDKFNVHFSVSSFKKGGRNIQYVKHRSFDGLIHISTEADYIRDHELMMWFDAINCTTYHPNVNDFLLSRWQTLGTLLDITGSRITEVHQITRSMIKEASKSLQDLDKTPIIRDIPILKGKYKDKTRPIITTNGDIQVIIWHITMVEKMFPGINHDAIFVDARSGSPLKALYLKNYARKVIDGSKYRRDLRHLNNHSFRHRFITLNIAKAIKKISVSGSFVNILTVAANACRKITMHASNETLSNYIHLASEYNNIMDSEVGQHSTQTKLLIKRMKVIAESVRSKQLNEKDALNSFLSTLDNFRSY